MERKKAAERRKKNEEEEEEEEEEEDERKYKLNFSELPTTNGYFWAKKDKEAGKEINTRGKTARKKERTQPKQPEY